MTTANEVKAKEKLAKFLHMIGRLREPALILVPPEKTAVTVESVKKSLSQDRLRILEVPPEQAADIRDTFLEIFKRDETLLAVVRLNSDRNVLRILEQILEEGALDSRKPKGWRPVKPSPSWSLVVIAEENRQDNTYFTLEALFPFKLRL